MLVLARGVENPSHIRGAKIAASDAVTHPQWASTAYYSNGIRDLWAGDPAALAFVQGYDRLAKTAAKTIKRSEGKLETQDRFDWLSSALQGILGGANVQGRSQKELLQELEKAYRNWTAIRLRNLHHCLQDDIVRRDAPNFSWKYGHRQSDRGNRLVHDSDIVEDATLSKAPDFENGYQSGTHPDTEIMPSLYKSLYSIPLDVALDISKSDLAENGLTSLQTSILRRCA